nr:MAG TPA: hypothetical protein [Bacteriophage sp.]
MNKNPQKRYREIGEMDQLAREVWAVDVESRLKKIAPKFRYQLSF